MPDFTIPNGWITGELLSQLLMANGVRFMPLYERRGIADYVEFTAMDEAQNFIGWWYAPVMH